jgi:DNA-binding winged helix-turn-helix (wHTH) protein
MMLSGPYDRVSISRLHRILDWSGMNRRFLTIKPRGFFFDENAAIVADRKVCPELFIWKTIDLDHIKPANSS